MQLNHFLGPVSPVRMWLLSGFKLMRGYYVGSVRNLVHRAMAELWVGLQSAEFGRSWECLGSAFPVSRCRRRCHLGPKTGPLHVMAFLWAVLDDVTCLLEWCKQSQGTSGNTKKTSCVIAHKLIRLSYFEIFCHSYVNGIEWRWQWRLCNEGRQGWRGWHGLGLLWAACVDGSRQGEHQIAQKALLITTAWHCFQHFQKKTLRTRIVYMLYTVLCAWKQGKLSAYVFVLS